MDIKLFSTIISAISCFVLCFALTLLTYNVYKNSKFRKDSIHKFRQHLGRKIFKEYPEAEEILSDIINSMNATIKICEYPLSGLFAKESMLRANIFKGTPQEREKIYNELCSITEEINKSFPEYLELVEKTKDSLRKLYLMTCYHETSTLSKKYKKLWDRSGYGEYITTMYEYFIKLHYNLTAHQNSGFDFIDHIILE